MADEIINKLKKCRYYKKVLRYVQILARWVFVVDVTTGVEAPNIMPVKKEGKEKKFFGSRPYSHPSIFSSAVNAHNIRYTRSTILMVRIIYTWCFSNHNDWNVFQVSSDTRAMSLFWILYGTN